MNTFELTTHTLYNCRESENRRYELSPSFLDAYNDGYRLICEEVLHPFTQESQVITADRRFGLSGLSQQVRQIQKISLYKDFSAQAQGRISREYPFINDGLGVIVIPNAEPGALLWFKYEYLPTPLTQASSADDVTPDTIPSLLPENYQMALSYYAAADFWGIHSSAERQKYWSDRFYNTVSNLKPNSDAATNKFKNRFPAQPF